MRLEDMRRSENVEDRRGLSIGRTGTRIGLGTIALLIVGYFLGLSPDTMLGLISATDSVTQGQGAAPVDAPHGRPSDPQGDFAAAVLGETEDVWSQYFAAAGQRYQPPTLVLFSDQVASALRDPSKLNGWVIASAVCAFAGLAWFGNRTLHRMDSGGKGKPATNPQPSMA